MSAVWIWAKKIKNAGVVDVFWALNFPVIAVVIYFLGEGTLLRKQLICGMVVIAGARLGLHLWQRVIGHLGEEEGRYRQLRKDWAPKADQKFFWFFQAQAISNVVLAAPFFLAGMNTTPEIHFLEYVAVVFWAIAVVGEGLADWQLQQFKKDPANKGEVCTTGLWNYSRHPNYFFQSLLWTAYFLFVLPASWGWVAVISPTVIIYLIFKITGIPLTEEQSIRSKGDKYLEYQRSTSVFFPWFKLKKR